MRVQGKTAGLRAEMTMYWPFFSPMRNSRVLQGGKAIGGRREEGCKVFVVPALAEVLGISQRIGWGSMCRLAAG